MVGEEGAGISALRKLRQEDCSEFQARDSYKEMTSFKTQNNTMKTPKPTQGC